jgi:methyltransferase
MILSIAFLAFITIQRLAELAIAGRNTRRLLARGAVEIGARHYPLVVLLHATWLAGLWLLGWNRPLNLPLLGVFLVLQALRVWVLMTLGERWTTRVVVLPGAPLVTGGPFRFFSHPNYAVVIGEIAVAPLAFGLIGFALVFSILNALVLWMRLSVEGPALAASNEAVRSSTNRPTAG